MSAAEDFADATRTERHDADLEQAAELDDLVAEAWDREPIAPRHIASGRGWINLCECSIGHDHNEWPL
jgi:hypothetical protein